MGRTLHKTKRGCFFVAMACAGVLLGTSVSAFAEGTASRTVESDQALAFQSGYIQAFPEPASGMVIGAREDKQLLGEGDVLYLRLAPTTSATVGDRFTLFRPTMPLYHPITREYMGRMVAILGIIEISKPTAEGVTEARVTRAYDVMAPGDLMKPYVAPPAAPDRQVTSGPVAGFVLDFQTSRQLVGQSEIAYLDKGAQDGVALGDRFTVSHQGRRLSTTSTHPDKTIADLKIIAVQARTSTAAVLQSADVIRRGDLIYRLLPPPLKTEQAAALPQDHGSDTLTSAQTRPPLADLHFAVDVWLLSQVGQTILAEHAAALKADPLRTMTLEGHTDEQGSQEHNLSLGDKRAQEVRRALISLGVTNVLTAVSYGKNRPVCAERNEACYVKNRRVHLADGH